MGGGVERRLLWGSVGGEQAGGEEVGEMEMAERAT